MDYYPECPMCHLPWGQCPYQPGSCAYVKTRDTDDTVRDARNQRRAAVCATILFLMITCAVML